MEQEEPNIKISKIHKEKIQENKAISQKLNTFKEKIKKENTFQKTIYSSEYDFYIETDYATYIENKDGSYHSYTFPILRKKDNKLIENLLLSLQPDGSYTSFLVSYKLNGKEKTKLQSGLKIDFSKIISFQKIDFNSQNIFSKTTIKCFSYGNEWCGDSNHQGGRYPDGSRCPAYESDLETYCIAGGDESSNNSTGNDSTESGDTNNGTGTATGTGTTHSDSATATAESYNFTSMTNCFDCPTLEEQKFIFFVENLSIESQSFLNQIGNTSLKKEIETFLNNNLDANEDYTTEAMNFAEEAIKAKNKNKDAEIDFDDKIINELTEKAKCLNDSLTKNGNTFVKDLLANFKGNSEFDINISSKDKVFRKNSSVELNGKTTYQPGSSLININISTSSLSNRSSLAGIRTLLHEYIHADMFRKLNTKYSSNGDLDFKQTYNHFKNVNFKPDPQHETMAELYINEMKLALKNIHLKLIPREVDYLEQSFGVNILNDIYESLAWQGLKNHKLKAWQDLGSDTTKINTTKELYLTALTKEFCK